MELLKDSGQDKVNGFESWGIQPYDNTCGGLLNSTFNLLRVHNQKSGLVAMGMFIKAGFKMREDVTLVGFDHPVHLLEKLQNYGFNFFSELNSEQLNYLYYKPSFSHPLSFATSYQKMRSELIRLSGNNCKRIGFINVDVLFNLETYLLAQSSVARILSAFVSPDYTILGYYQATNSAAHQHLDNVARNLMGSYIEIKPIAADDSQRYKLLVHNAPVANPEQSIELMLSANSGFMAPNVELVKYG